MVSARGGDKLDSRRDSAQASSNKNISGAIVGGCVVNQVMLQNAPIGPSEFDPNLENDFSADEITMLFETGRLAQFQEDYAMLKAAEDTEKKIIIKQILFMKYERELKKQDKEKKHLREQLRRERRARAGQHEDPANQVSQVNHSRRHSSLGGSLLN